MIVVDASVVVTALLDDGAHGHAVRTRLRGTDIAAPAHLDVEVLHAFRGLLTSRRTTAARAARAIAQLVRLPLQRVELPVVAARTWQLRSNLTAYDAAYVALAEHLAAPLLTADARLARSTGPRCLIELLGSARS